MQNLNIALYQTTRRHILENNRDNLTRAFNTLCYQFVFYSALIFIPSLPVY